MWLLAERIPEYSRDDPGRCHFWARPLAWRGRTRAPGCCEGHGEALCSLRERISLAPGWLAAVVAEAGAGCVMTLTRVQGVYGPVKPRNTSYLECWARACGDHTGSSYLSSGPRFKPASLALRSKRVSKIWVHARSQAWMVSIPRRTLKLPSDGKDAGCGPHGLKARQCFRKLYCLQYHPMPGVTRHVVFS